MGATIFDRLAKEIESDYSESEQYDDTAEQYIGNNGWQ